jgi:hypothetical protein
MKTSEQINIEIKQLEDQRIDLDNQDNDRLYKKAGKRVAFLRSCLFYVEGQPRQEFVERQLDLLEIKLELINKGFGEWCKNTPNIDNKTLVQRKAEYNAALDVKTIKQQIKTLIYILK